MTRRVLRIVSWIAIAVLAVVVTALAGFLYLTRAGGGQAFVLERVLERLRPRIAGEVRVGRIASADLIRGATLYQVEIDGAEGRPILRVDSLSAAFSAWTFLSGDVVLADLRLWGPRIVLERSPGDSVFDIERLLLPSETGAGEGVAPGAEPPGVGTPSGEGREIAIRDLTLHQGMVEIRTPYDPSQEGDPRAEENGAGQGSPRPIVEPALGGEGQVRVLRFSGVEGRLADLVVANRGDRAAPSASIHSLALEASIFEESVRIESLQGRFTYDEGLIRIDSTEVRLPGTSARGGIAVDTRGEGTIATAELDMDRFALADFRWAMPGLPDGEGTGTLDLRWSPDSTRLTLAGGDLRTGASRVRGSTSILLDGETRIDAADLDLDPLVLADLEPFLEDSLPVAGTLRGRTRLSGVLPRVRLDADLVFVDPRRAESPVTARIDGALHLGDPFVAEDFHVILDPFDFGYLQVYAENLNLDGQGRIELRADGNIGMGLTVDANLVHRPAGQPTSRIHVAGEVRDLGDDWRLDLSGDLQPLSLDALRLYYPRVPARGELSGAFTAAGTLSDLEVTTDLNTAGGRLPLRARLNPRDPAVGYRLSASFDQYRLSALVDTLPEPTIVSGDVVVEASGFVLDSIAGTASVTLRGSRVGPLDIDSLMVAAAAEDSRLRVDTLVAATQVGRLWGGGELALVDGPVEGTLDLGFRLDSLVSVRRLLAGDSLIAVDQLTQLERQALELEGIDPDTLPTTDEIRAEGAIEGEAVLRGSVRAFSAEGEMRFAGIAWGKSFVRDGVVTFSADGLPGRTGPLSARLVADSLRVEEREFAGTEVELEYEEPEGRVVWSLRRNDAEDYRARASYALDLEGGGGTVYLDELTLRFEPVRWNLQGPATIAWSDSSVTVRDFALLRPGTDGMRIAASGVFPLRGEGDFTVDIRDLQVARLVSLAQSERTIEGLVSTNVRITGSAEEPVVTGNVAIEGLTLEEFTLDRLDGEVSYANQQLTGELGAWSRGIRIARIEGTAPYHIALDSLSFGVLEEEALRVSVVADSLPLDLAAGFTRQLQGIQGHLVGNVDITGTPRDPSFSGGFELVGGSAFVEPVGLRYRSVQGSFDLRSDGSVGVNLTARSGGRARIVGTIGLARGAAQDAPAFEPSFDLRIGLDGFAAVDRPDLTATVSTQRDSLRLTGIYSRPVLDGSLVVDGGTLRGDELERRSRVAALLDPGFEDLLGAQTEGGREVLAARPNPFLDNLRMNVRLSVNRNFRFENAEMDVEIRSDEEPLIVVWDRQSNEFAILGALQATRGAYRTFGKSFEVREGTVQFVGTPGIDPNLDIVAVHRLPLSNQRPLEVAAHLQGTVQNPRVRLYSESDPNIPQDDLISYLVFGRPVHQLSQGESAIVQGAAGSFLGAAAGAGASIALGSLTNQIGAAVARDLGVDYFAVSQGQSEFNRSFLGSTVASTLIEVGWYLDEDVFLAVLLRPLVSVGGTRQSEFAGVRGEFTLGDRWVLETFVEDRFTRGRLLGFGAGGVQISKEWGLFLFREWGY